MYILRFNFVGQMCPNDASEIMKSIFNSQAALASYYTQLQIFCYHQHVKIVVIVVFTMENSKRILQGLADAFINNFIVYFMHALYREGGLFVNTVSCLTCLLCTRSNIIKKLKFDLKKKHTRDMFVHLYAFFMNSNMQ